MNDHLPGDKLDSFDNLTSSMYGVIDGKANGRLNAADCNEAGHASLGHAAHVVLQLDVPGVEFHFSERPAN
jgi:hypothetical protein